MRGLHVPELRIRQGEVTGAGITCLICLQDCFCGNGTENICFNTVYSMTNVITLFSRSGFHYTLMMLWTCYFI